MSVVIKLDGSAIRALFPEGSETRLELTNAVIQETVKRMRVPDNAGVQRAINEAVQKLVKEIPAAYCNTNSYTPILSDKAKALIASQVQSAYISVFTAEVNTKIGECGNAAKDELYKVLEAKVENHFTKIAAELDRQARQMLIDKISGVVNAVATLPSSVKE